MTDLQTAMQNVDRTEAIGGAGAPLGEARRPKIALAPVYGEDAVREALSDTSVVEHPPHYGGIDDPYETIKVIEAWGLNFHLGTSVKYISRAGKKDRVKTIEDLKKSRWYLDREIMNLEAVE